MRLDPGTTKNGEGRVIRLTAECFELVRACIAGKRPEEPVLTYEGGQPVRAYRFAWEQLWVWAGVGRFVCRACHTVGPATAATGRVCATCAKAKKRGILAYEGTLFHDLRRTAVRDLRACGCSEFRGHEDHWPQNESVYRRYAIVCEADLSEAVNRLEQLTPQLTPASEARQREQAKVN